MLAFALGRDLGIDIEQIRADFATDDIAERFFSAYEVETLRALPPEQHAEAFFTCWTRKEAFIKAIGEGLSCPLDKFDVTLGPEEPASLLATRVEGQPASKWSMRSLDAGEGFKAAIVVEGQNWDLRVRSWEEATA
ncbi:MAG TPA: 4'-phosphopantetheinyl transferase superfamily protein [Blastocatellia bacterium]